jgi:hypothetical protein
VRPGHYENENTETIVGERIMISILLRGMLLHLLVPNQLAHLAHSYERDMRETKYNSRLVGVTELGAAASNLRVYLSMRVSVKECEKALRSLGSIGDLAQVQSTYGNSWMEVGI